MLRLGVGFRVRHSVWVRVRIMLRLMLMVGVGVRVSALLLKMFLYWSAKIFWLNSIKK